jgi:uncharacterized phiE125 gp8 family phage protein
MSDWYERSETNTGEPPIKLSDLKTYLRVSGDADNDVLTLMLGAATDYGEQYTGREFRANTYVLHMDAFAGSRICLRRSPVASVTSITHLVSGSPVTITASDYYLKKGPRFSEIVLTSTASWPTNTDDIEHAIEVTFVTEAYSRIDLCKLALQQHLAHVYENRGDDSVLLASNSRRSGGVLGSEGALASGAIGLYNQVRIPRV